jgi:hypothetical protein
VSGVNSMLDAIPLPIGEANRILAQIATGKIDELIAQSYKRSRQNEGCGEDSGRRAAKVRKLPGKTDRLGSGRTAQGTG